MTTITDNLEANVNSRWKLCSHLFENVIQQLVAMFHFIIFLPFSPIFTTLWVIGQWFLHVICLPLFSSMLLCLGIVFDLHHGVMLLLCAPKFCTIIIFDDTTSSKYIGTVLCTRYRPTVLCRRITTIKTLLQYMVYVCLYVCMCDVLKIFSAATKFVLAFHHHFSSLPPTATPL